MNISTGGGTLMARLLLIACTVLGCDNREDSSDDDSDTEPGGDADSDSDADTDSDGDADSDSDSDGDADSDTDADSDADGDTGSDMDTDSDSDGDGDSDTDADADTDSDGDTDGDSDGDTEGETDRDTDGDTDSDTNPSPDGGTDEPADGGGTDPDRSDMFEIIGAMDACVNLGNWLDAPNQDWGVICDESDLIRIADKGFDTIRLPIRWETRAMDTAPYTIDEAFFGLVDDTLGWAAGSGLAVVMNMHHHDAFFSDAESRKDQFLAMWEQIASRYRDQPNSVIFEILNEPHDSVTEERWNQYLLDALAVIRLDNPTRPVVIGPADWGHVSGMDRLILPDDPNVIFTVHYYDPLEFTHQGASWVEGSDQWLGTTWDGIDAEEAAIRDELDFVAGWADDNNVPVFLGEFGAYNRADMDSRARWTEAVSRISEELGFAWCYWEYKGEFGVWDQGSATWNTPLTDALLSRTEQQ